MMMMKMMMIMMVIIIIIILIASAQRISMLWSVKYFSIKESDIYFLLGQANNTPKVTFNL